MLRRARRRVKSARPTYVAADMTRLPFPEGTFDCVTCGYVIEHLPDPRPGLEEIGRVLKPGGSLLLLATEDTYSGAVVSRTWKCRTYNRDELRQSCEQSGLPWHDELWFTPVHRFFRMGGILVEAQKPAEEAPETRGDA
jgi:ubiquinone/menaquinone biosynthesis C-methylase UbiE